MWIAVATCAYIEKHIYIYIHLIYIYKHIWYTCICIYIGMSIHRYVHNMCNWMYYPFHRSHELRHLTRCHYVSNSWWQRPTTPTACPTYLVGWKLFRFLVVDLVQFWVPKWQPMVTVCLNIGGQLFNNLNALLRCVPENIRPQDRQKVTNIIYVLQAITQYLKTKQNV